MRGHGNWGYAAQMMIINTMAINRSTHIYCKNEEFRDAESVNTQETTLERDASDVEVAALDKESTAIRGSLSDWSFWETVTQKTSHSHRQLESLKRHWNKQTGKSANTENYQENFRNVLEKSGPILL